MSNMIFEINREDGSNILNSTQATQVLITEKVTVKFGDNFTKTPFTGDSFTALNNGQYLYNPIEGSYESPDKLNIEGSRKLCWIRPLSSSPVCIISSGYSIQYPEVSNVFLAGKEGELFSVAMTNSTNFKGVKESQSSKFIEVRNDKNELIWSYNTLRQSPVIVAKLKVPLDESVVSVNIPTDFDVKNVYIMGGEFCGDYDFPNDLAVRYMPSGIFCKFDGNVFYARFVHRPRGGGGLSTEKNGLFIFVYLAYIPDYDGSYFLT